MAWVPSCYLNSISEAQFNALLSDINSITPETIATLGVSGLRLHGNTVNAALNNAFGGTNGMNNPATQASLINNWTPADPAAKTRFMADQKQAYSMGAVSGYHL